MGRKGDHRRSEARRGGRTEDRPDQVASAANMKGLLRAHEPSPSRGGCKFEELLSLRQSRRRQGREGAGGRGGKEKRPQKKRRHLAIGGRILARDDREGRDFNCWPRDCCFRSLDGGATAFLLCFYPSALEPNQRPAFFSSLSIFSFFLISHMHLSFLRSDLHN